MISLARRHSRPKSSTHVTAGAGVSKIDLWNRGPWPRDDDRRDDWDVELEILALPPEQKLRDAVDLVVVSSVGEGQKLRQELTEPRRVLGKMDVAPGGADRVVVRF